MNRVFETLFKFVNKYFILIAIVLIILNIYFFTITRQEEYFTENLKKNTTESKTESRTENRNVESKPWNYVKMYIYRTDPREDLYNIYSKLIENKTNAEKKSILRKWKRKIKKYLQELAITVATAAKRLRHSTGQAKDNLDDRIELLKSRIQQLKKTRVEIRDAISKISSE